MRSLWTRIGLGAVGVFAVGMLGVTLFREAAAATSRAVGEVLHRTVHGATRAGMQQRAFRLDGQNLGSLRQVSVQRLERGGLPEVAVDVELHDMAYMKRLAGCDLVPATGRGGADFNPEQGFRCATALEKPLMGIGTARFLPGGIVRPILVSRAHEAELRQGDPFEATADLSGQVRVTASDRGGEIVKVLADSAGASIHVRDGQGRSLVRLVADSSGAMLRVRDQQGREIVRLDAGGGRFALSVDSVIAP
jgi:hypothetical protein